MAKVSLCSETRIIQANKYVAEGQKLTVRSGGTKTHSTFRRDKNSQYVQEGQKLTVRAGGTKTQYVPESPPPRPRP